MAVLSASGYSIPETGQIVRVRSRQFLVEEVVLPPEPWNQTLVRLSCLDDDAQGDQLDVLWEAEVDAQMVDGTSWKHVGASGFDSPRLFSAYLHALRWNCVTSTNPRLFQAPFRAGIEVMAYQLEPLRKALRLPRVNLFIADDVGLGKTIEAGLILRELLIRQKVRRVVVAAPPSMLLQWRDELESRFGLTFVIFDREYVAAVRRERGYSVNPWRTHSRFLISHALVRDEGYANLLRDWLDESARGSLLILDEAHNAAPASGSRYAIDSMLTRAVRELASRFEHRLFLSATPHNGHPNSFAALLELLDPQRFDRVPIEDIKRLEPIMVRRLKSDLRDAGIDFPKRRVIEISIEDLPADAPELKLSVLLDRYARAREQRIQPESRSAQAASALIISCLQKRLVSSIEAFYRTLNVHRRAVERALEKASSAPPPREDQLSLLREAPSADDTRAELSANEIGAEEEAEMEAATRATVAGKASQRDLVAAELAMIDEMVAISDQARGRADRRIEHLVRWIGENLCPDLPTTGVRWNRRRVLIFTEYLDTKRYLEQQLAAGIAGSDRSEVRIASFVGGVDEDREAIKRAFNADPDKYPLRILIATDAAREGVNLQNYCADLFHFDLPWNPSRMEQRNGRIDRKLQREPEVRCHYFVFTQRHEDRVLRALARKTETIQRELGSLSPVLATRLTARVERGFRRNEADRIIGEIEKEDLPEDQRAAVSQELEPIREHKAELNRQLDVLRGLMETSKESIGLWEEHFRDALCCALELQGAKPLELVTSASKEGPQRWRFPAIADPAWTDTLDALRTPRKPDQPIWEWRKDAPLRSVVFKDSGRIDEEVVHLHLEHRVVRRLLGRFLAQGFAHDLAGATALLTDDAIPRVVLFGRLSLFGVEAARLHDEIIAVTAQWFDPESRTTPLRPYSERTEDKTLRLLDEALEGRLDESLPETVTRNLKSGIERDVTDLLPHLSRRASDAQASAVERLRERGEREARDMVAILEAQRTRIARELDRFDTAQLELNFTETERRQREADRRHWEHRLRAISGELDAEPARIRASYEASTHRVESVGVVYLWPRSG
jgi:ERCC4-related helicase